MSKEEVRKDIMDRYLDLVSRTSFRILCDSEDSIAVTMDVFDYVSSHIDDFDGEHPLRQWILSVTCWKSRLRITRRRLMYILGRRPDLYFTSSPKIQDQDDYVTKQAWEIYCRASLKLTAGQRIVFALGTLEQLTDEEIADITGMSVFRIRYATAAAEGTVKAELARFGKMESYPDYIRFVRNVVIDTLRQPAP